MKAISQAITALRAREVELEEQLGLVRRAITALDRPNGQPSHGRAPKRQLSAAGREAIARAARKRWAKWRKAQRA